MGFELIEQGRCQLAQVHPPGVEHRTVKYTANIRKLWTYVYAVLRDPMLPPTFAISRNAAAS